MSASLELDGPVSVGGMGSRVLVGKPNVALQAHVDAWHNGVRCSVLSAAASAKTSQVSRRNVMTVTAPPAYDSLNFSVQYERILNVNLGLSASSCVPHFNGFYEQDSR